MSYLPFPRGTSAAVILDENWSRNIPVTQTLAELHRMGHRDWNLRDVVYAYDDRDFEMESWFARTPALIPTGRQPV